MSDMETQSDSPQFLSKIRDMLYARQHNVLFGDIRALYILRAICRQISGSDSKIIEIKVVNPPTGHNGSVYMLAIDKTYPVAELNKMLRIADIPGEKRFSQEKDIIGIGDPSNQELLMVAVLSMEKPISKHSTN